MTSLINHRGSDVHFAQHDPATALASLFRPISRGPRPKGLDLTVEHDGASIRFTSFEWLDSRDQSVLLAAVGLAGIDGADLHSDVEGAIGQQLWLDLQPTAKATSDSAVAITTTHYALLKAAGLGTSSRDYERLKDALYRLSQVGCRAKANGWDWSMRFLSYAANDDGTVHIALNSRFAAALAGQFVRVSMTERRQLGHDVAQLTHTWLNAAIRPGSSMSVMLDNLAYRVWGTEPQTEPTRRKRRLKLSKALDEISQLHGWKVSITGKGIRAKATIKRPKVQSDLVSC